MFFLIYEQEANNLYFHAKMEIFPNTLWNVDEYSNVSSVTTLQLSGVTTFQRSECYYNVKQFLDNNCINVGI